jgi:HNH endonuclease
MKICCHCKEELSLDSFQKNRTAPDGLQYRCKDCTKKASKACRAKRGHLWLEKTNPWDKRPENRERRNANTRLRRARDPEKAKAENKYWRERANPYSTAVSKAGIRAKELGIESTLTAEEWKFVVERENFICHLCGSKTSLDLKSPWRLSLDHVLPIAKGGSNTVGNVLPAHRRCNQSRLDMTLEEFDLWLKKIFLFRGNDGKAQCISL